VLGGDQAWFYWAEKLIFDADIVQRPLLSVAVLAILAGVQLVLDFGPAGRLQDAQLSRKPGVRPIYRVRDSLAGRLSGAGKSG